MKRMPLLILLCCIASASFAVTVTLTSPTMNSSASSPLHLVASAQSQYPITGWVAYADSITVYVGPASPTVDAWFPVALGTHQLVVRAWDSQGAYASQMVAVTVVPDGLPTPPQNAIVYNNIQLMGNWGSCNSPGCAGGSGQGAFWMAQNQRTPSLSGASMEFFNSGVWANALWWQKVGNNNSARNFLWDFYFYVDQTASLTAQAIEFDSFQFLGGYNYMMGTQCVYPSQIWDTWDEATGQWIHTNIACPRFTPNTWHHYRLYTQTIPESHQYKYVTLVLDGQSIPLNIFRNAKYVNWWNNSGIQCQLDVNQYGIGYHEWIDNAKLTVW